MKKKPVKKLCKKEYNKAMRKKPLPNYHLANAFYLLAELFQKAAFTTKQWAEAFLKASKKSNE